MSSINPLFGENLLNNLSFTKLTLSETLVLAIEDTQLYLREFASHPEFMAKLQTAFGESFDTAEALKLSQNWTKGDFAALPPIEILDAWEIKGANGAFARENNTIYLSREFILQNADNPNLITNVILEEIGHYVDSRINVSDAAGDEGAIFAAVVQGIELTPQELGILRTEDDTAIININGQDIIIEQSINLETILNRIRNTINQNLGSAFEVVFENPNSTNTFKFIVKPGNSIDSNIKGFLPNILGLVDPNTEGGFSLKNITLDTQSLLGASSFLGKIKETLGKIITPIQPLIDTLLSPVPFLNDLYTQIGGGLQVLSGYDKNTSSISVLDVIGFVAKTQDINFDPSLVVEGVKIFNFLDNIQLKNGIDLGSINFDINGNSVRQGLPNISLISNDLSSVGGLSIPLLQDPTNTVLDLLLGKNVDLFTYRLPSFELEGTITQVIPIIGPLGVSVGGTFDIETNLGFGFDTSGFKTNTIEKGIYFTDRNANGVDIPEFKFGIGPTIGVGLQVAVASIDIFQGMSLNLGLNLNDKNGDGKFNLDEFDSNKPFSTFDYNFGLGAKFGGSVKILGANIFAPQTPDFTVPLGTFSGDTVQSGVNKLTQGFSDIKSKLSDSIDDIKKALDVKIPDPVEFVKNVGDALGDGANAAKDAANKGLNNLDPTNPNSPVGRSLADLDPTNPNSIAGSLVKGAENALAKLDPFNPNSPVGRAIADVGRELQNVGKAAAELDITNRNSTAGKLWAKTGLPPIKVSKPKFLSFSLQASSTPISKAEELQNLLTQIGYNQRRMSEINTYLEGVVSGRISVARRSGETELQAKNRVIQEEKTKFNNHKREAERLVGIVKSNNWRELIKEELLRNGITLEGLDGDDVFVSSTGKDTLKGNGGNDNLSSGPGRDNLFGGRGKDYLNGGADNDSLYGGSGSDEIYGGTGHDDLYGYATVDDPNESDNDSLYGGSGDDYLVGDKGDDLLRGGDGSSLDPANPDRTDKDALYGGSGNDTLYGGEDNDYLYGDSGNDSLYGEAGNDRLKGGTDNDFLDGGTGIDYLDGEAGNDTIRGGSDNDYLEGGAGIDYLYGDGGSDVLKGGSETDYLYGGDGIDRLWGEQATDFLYGDNQNDFLYGGESTDYLYGGAGDDYLYGGIEGNDVFDSSVDILYGEDGNDRLYGQAGNDELYGGNGNDFLYGGDGIDRLSGGNNEDYLYGDQGNDDLSGGNGIDRLYGGEGDDVLRGDEGDDALYGGNGNDTLYANGGADYLNGGYPNNPSSGNDTYNIASIASGGTIIEDYDGFVTDNDQLWLPIGLSEDLPTGLDTSAVKSFQRQGQDLIIDLNQDGSFATQFDITVKNFFLRDLNTREPLYLLEKINNHITGDALLKHFNIAPKINLGNNFNLDGVDLIPNANNGNLISEIIPDGGFSDPDVAVDAIAITSIDNNRIGTWQYSLDNGQTWQDFASVSESNALLLKPSDRVRFNPDLDKIKALQTTLNNSWKESQFSFRAWDISDDQPSGTYSNITKTGGNSAFSTETATSKVSLLLEPPINTWSQEIKNYPATFTDPTLTTVVKTPSDVGIILHDAVMGDKNIFLVGNTTGILWEGQNFFGGYNDTWVASVDIATGNINGKVVLATSVSDARAKVAWAKTNPDTVYMSFRSLDTNTFNEAGWLNKYNFVTGEHKFVNVANSSTGLRYPVDIDTDNNGNVYVLLNIKNSVSGDGKADNKVIVYNSNLEVINSFDFGDGVIANKIVVSSPGFFAVAGFKTTDGVLSGYDVGYDVLENTHNNTKSIYVAEALLSTTTNQYSLVDPFEFSFYQFDSPSSNIKIKTSDIVTDLYADNNSGLIYLTTNSSAIVIDNRFGLYSAKLFKPEQTVTGLSIDENDNLYVLGKTSVTGIGGSSWITKYDASLRTSPHTRFDEAPAIWHKANAQGAAQNGVNFFPNELLFDPNNKLGMALFGRATTEDSPSDVFAAPGDYVWGTGLKSINHAPILIDSENIGFLNNNLSNTIYLDSKPLSVYSVGNLISLNNGSNPNTGSALMGDWDGDTLGIAITNVDNTNGEWQFSIDNGTSWFGSDIELRVEGVDNYSDNFARLLGPETLMRFVPKQGYIGSSSFNFRLWDLTNQDDRNNFKVSITASLIDQEAKDRNPNSYSVGGYDTPYSVVTSTAKIEITNYAPVFDATYLPQLPSISYKNTNSTGNTVESLAPYGAIEDGTYNFLNDATGKVEYLTPDKAVKAIAVTSVDNSNGRWQFATSTNNWQDFGNVTENNARLLSSSHKIRFVPNTGYIGQAFFTFRAWDQTNGNDGGIFDATANGGSTPFSSQTRIATITTYNTAPILNTSGNPSLNSISHNNPNDSGKTVSQLVIDGSITDADGAIEAIAVTSVDNSKGIWQYSLDNGQSWLNFGVVSQGQARLLASSHKIRFVPNLNFVGEASFSFKAWDGSNGIPGLVANVINNGGRTPFSINTETAKINVTNTAPTFIGTPPIVSIFNPTDEFRLDTASSHLKASPHIARFASGGFVVTWQSFLQDGNSNGIFAQRYDAKGLPIGQEFRVNTYTTGSQENPSVAVLADDKFIVTWESPQDGSGDGVYGQLYNANGSPIGAEFRVNTATQFYQENPAIAALSDGGFLITYESSTDVIGKRYDAQGSPVGGEFVVKTLATSLSSIGLANGGYILAYQDYSSSPSKISAQRYQNNGLAIGSSIQVSTSGLKIVSNPAITELMNGNFVVTWDSGDYNDDLSLLGDGAGIGIFARVFDANGNPLSQQFLVNQSIEGDQGNPSIAPLQDGGFVISWQSPHQEEFSFYSDIYGRYFDKFGNSTSNEFKINVEIDDDQSNPSFSTLTDGSFIVAWETNGFNGIHARRFIPENSSIFNLTSITNRNSNPQGQIIAEIIPDNVISDNDGNPQKAIAIVSADNRYGIWQYSLDFGDTWLPLGTVSETLALLLDADSKIRFVPKAGFVGNATFDFRAWDKNNGIVGTLVNTTTNGGNTAFSTAIQKAEIKVTNLDDKGETIATALDTKLTAKNKGYFEFNGKIGDNLSKLPGYDVDFYKVQLNQGDIINVKVATGGLNSPLDAMIWLYDSLGTKLAFSDDSTGSTEPFFSFLAPYNDTFYISVSASGNYTPSAFIEENRNEITATSGNYSIYINSPGNALDNTLTSNSGNDTLNGEGGNDTLNGGAGNDSINGGDGNDTMRGEAGNDSLNGGSGNDAISGGDGNDRIQGNAGNDTIDGGNGIDTLAETGDFSFVLTNTSLSGNGNDSFLKIEQVELTGGIGNNTINASAFTLGSVILNGGTGNDTMMGGSGNDTMRGEAGNDALAGGEGNDAISGGDGNDRIAGGAGNDTIDGGNGIDTLAETGDFSFILSNNSLTGNGSDTLVRIEQAELTGGIGNNTLNASAFTIGSVILNGGSGNDTMMGGSGNDTMRGEAGNDAISGGEGNDAISGGDGNDRIRGNAGNDTIDGGNGIDTLVESGDFSFVLTNTSLLGNGNDSFTKIEQVELTGGIGNNTLNASAFTLGSVILNGGAGNDSLIGGLGNDSLIGGTGNDTINGGIGNDSLIGGDGNDTMRGETGNDSLNGDIGNDAISGGDGNDRIAGGTGNDTIDGGNGIDTLAETGDFSFILTNTSLSGNGNDSFLKIEQAELTGGIGNNTINASAFTLGSVILNGGDGNDALTGGSGNDILTGGNGNDTLVGGLGNDTLTGGTGSDRFTFNSPNQGNDRIMDFSVVDDTIAVSAAGFGGSLVANAAITAAQFIIGSNTTTASQRFIYNNTTGGLFFDVDGTGLTAKTQIATLSTGLLMTNNDILIVT